MTNACSVTLTFTGTQKQPHVSYSEVIQYLDTCLGWLAVCDAVPKD